MNQKLLIGVVAAAVVIAGAVWWLNGREGEVREGVGMPAPVSGEANTMGESQGSEGGMMGGGMMGASRTGEGMMPRQGALREFAVEASNFKFSVNELKVKKGDTVRITLTDKEGRHDWRVDEFDAATKVLQQVGQVERIDFVADKAGRFEYYCSVGNHRAMGMRGMLVIEE